MCRYWGTFGRLLMQRQEIREMSETPSHKIAKKKAAGPHGRTEVPLPGGGRLDALSPQGRATEVERSGDPKQLTKAVRRLKRSRARQHVLQVPQMDMSKAAAAMRRGGLPGTVKNMKGTKRRQVQITPSH